MQEEMLPLVIDRLLPSTPPAIHYLLKVVVARVVRVKYEERAISTCVVVVDSQQRVCQNPSSCKYKKIILGNVFLNQEDM